LQKINYHRKQPKIASTKEKGKYNTKNISTHYLNSSPSYIVT
jgi:hypothetical protein